MLKLRKVGKKHQASFRLIVGEKRHKLQGKQVEDLGWYNPRQDKHQLNQDRINYWLKTGAQITDTVHNLLVSAGVLKAKKIPVHKSRRANSQDKEAGTPTGASEQPKKQEPTT